jgi:hypothetical protein
MSTLSLPWSKVEAGMRVELGGRTWSVDKVKLKGKLVKVTVTSSVGTFTRELKAKAEVTIARPEPLRDKRGAQTRWATEKELGAAGLAKGDPTATKPPTKTKGGSPWDKPAGQAERVLADGLRAVLVGEAADETRGYYVPPVDLTTVAAHMMLFHGGDAWAEKGEAELLTMHTIQHEQAKTTGAAFAVNHWHTKARP